MNYYVENWKRNKPVSRLIAATFPDYRRQKISINSSGRCTFLDLNWSGGTRSQYKGATLAGESTGSLDRFNAMAPWDIRQIEGQTIDIPPGHCVIRGGFSCGKASLLTIYVNAADVPKYLPAP